MLGALGVLRLSDSPVESMSIPSVFSRVGSHASTWGWSHWKKSLESLCLISFQVEGSLGLLLHSSLQCGSRKSLSFRMEGEAPEVVESNIKLYLSQVKSEEA